MKDNSGQYECQIDNQGTIMDNEGTIKSNDGK